MNFETVTEFENKIAEFFGAPYAVAVDSCTHGLELCLRISGAKSISCPRHTYLSVPMLANKLNIELEWRDEEWVDYYSIWGNHIFDAAVLWKRNSYIPKSLMCISFQYQKHLSLGRGGVILCHSSFIYDKLKKLSYDGREPGIPWRDQNIDIMGYHYYMPIEIAALGLEKLTKAIQAEPRRWVLSDWPDISKFKVFIK